MKTGINDIRYEIAESCQYMNVCNKVFTNCTGKQQPFENHQRPLTFFWYGSLIYIYTRNT